MSESYLDRVHLRRQELKEFLQWALAYEAVHGSMRWQDRADLKDAETLDLDAFTEAWWGVVLMTAYGRAATAATLVHGWPQLRRPLRAEEAQEVFREVEEVRRADPRTFPKPLLGEHRSSARPRGAIEAVISACRSTDQFRRTLSEHGTFDKRYMRMFEPRPPWWGRTTIYDLLLRAGHLGIDGSHYAPEMAYLFDAGSSGAPKGFALVFGLELKPETVDYCEGILAWWTANWPDICEAVEVRWQGDAYTPADFENALCIYHSVKAAS